MKLICFLPNCVALAELQQAQLAAEGRVADAEAAAAQLKEWRGALAARRADLQQELGVAERQAASARSVKQQLAAGWHILPSSTLHAFLAPVTPLHQMRRTEQAEQWLTALPPLQAARRLRLPELEAQKKAAAAVRDFKEAARLSAKAKVGCSSGFRV